MVHILKKYCENQKGIIIINSKELPLKFIQNFCKEIYKKYYIISHDYANIPIDIKSIISLVLLPDSKCIKSNYIPFTTRVFLDKIYKPIDTDIANQNLKKIFDKYEIKFNFDNITEKIFDFLYVGTCVPKKNTIPVMNQLSKYLTKYNKNKCCMILQITPFHYKNSIYNKYMKDLHKLYSKFPSNIKSRLLIIETNKYNFSNKLYYGLQPDELVNLYNTTKCYIHGCFHEAESRTIHEALLCECIIITYYKMLGGGKDFLNSQNSILYTNINNLLPIFEKSIIKSINYKVDPKYQYLFNEQFTIEKFRKILYEKLKYKINYHEFILDNTTNLMFSLAGHNLTVPWKISNQWGADITVPTQLKIINKYL